MMASTQTMGAAMKTMSAMKMSAKGKSATSSAEGPESVLRTISTSRNRACQWAFGLLSSSDSGTASTLSNSLRPTPTSMRSAAFCMIRLRPWRNR